MAEMVRINTRISKDAHDWLEEYSEQSGVPKSTIMFLAIEEYKKQKQVMNMMGGMGELVAKLEELSNKLDDK